MKPYRLWQLGWLLAAVPLAALAQATGPAPSEVAGSGTTETAYGPVAGSREFSLGGNGTTDRALNSSLGGGAASFGYYFSDTAEALIRQSLSYSNPRGGGGNIWNGVTSLAFDEALVAQGPVRPFVGVNTGYVYGNTVRSSWDAGLEGGVKVYVMPRTFIYTMADYGWFFRHDKAIVSQFSTGEWNWSVGMGFDF